MKEAKQRVSQLVQNVKREVKRPEFPCGFL
jgi:hypothetical protein